MKLDIVEWMEKLDSENKHYDLLKTLEKNMTVTHSMEILITNFICIKLKKKWENTW